MKFRLAPAVFVLALVGAPSAVAPLAAQSAYAIHNGSDLYRIRLTDAGTSLVGPTGFTTILAIDVHPTTGELYGIDSTTGQLVRIDPASGAAAGVGDLGFPFAPPVGLTFDDAGTLWMTARHLGFAGPLPVFVLVTVDLETGSSTLRAILDDPIPIDLFSRHGSLRTVAGIQVGRLNPDTGETTDLVTLSFAPSSADLDDRSGFLYTLRILPSAAPCGLDCAVELIRVDSSTWEDDFVGIPGPGVNTLAVAPRIAATSIPTLAGSSLVLLGLLLAGAASVLFRKARPA